MSQLLPPDSCPPGDILSEAMSYLYLSVGMCRDLIKEHDQGAIRLTERHVVWLAVLAQDLHLCADKLSLHIKERESQLEDEAS